MWSGGQIGAYRSTIGLTSKSLLFSSLFLKRIWSSLSFRMNLALCSNLNSSINKNLSLEVRTFLHFIFSSGSLCEENFQNVNLGNIWTQLKTFVNWYFRSNASDIRCILWKHLWISNMKYTRNKNHFNKMWHRNFKISHSSGELAKILDFETVP